MLPTDLDPVSRMLMGRTLVRVGIAVLILGAIAAAAIALTPTDPTQSSTNQNVVFGLAFCAGPALLGGIPSIIVGKGMMRHEHRDDIGSLYRGDT